MVSFGYEGEIHEISIPTRSREGHADANHLYTFHAAGALACLAKDHGLVYLATKDDSISRHRICKLYDAVETLPITTQ